MANNPNNEELFVVAIDIGTTFTGCAYSTKSDYKLDPLRIYSNTPWSTNKYRPEKAPSVILLNPDGSLHSLGFEAQDKYVELVESQDHVQWKYFTDLKMKLYSERGTKVSRDLQIEDSEGRPFRVMKLFEFILLYLKENFLEQINRAYQGVQLSDIKWVVTVPAIWNDSSKQFMREAAINAGIPTEHLILALEPECAAVYCQHAEMKRTQKEGKTSLNVFEAGSKFLLLDLGGGTVDITVQEVDRNGSLKQLYKANGGAWGGNNVNKAFQTFLQDIFPDVYRDFSNTERCDYLELERSFEQKKKELKRTSGAYKEHIQITLPQALIEPNKPHQSAKSLCAKLEGKAQIIGGNKLRITMGVFKGLFDLTLGKLAEHLSSLLQNKIISDIGTILAVGGFSASPIVQDMLRALFKDKCVLVPDQSGNATLEGAVIFGHNQRSVSSRKSQYSYGIEVHGIFDEQVHPIKKRFRDGTTQWCKDMFGIFVKVNETVIPGETKINRKYSVDKSANELPITIYYTEKESPIFVDEDGCQSLGECILDMSESIGQENRSVKVSMGFGNTEIEVTATDMITRNKVKTKVDFL